MQEQQYTGMPTTYSYDGTSNNSGGLVQFLLGLFTGVAVAAPITALIVKKICDNDKQKAVEQARIDGENRGIEAAVAVAKEEMAKGAGTPPEAISEANRGISEAVFNYEEVGKEYGIKDEAYLASLQGPTDDDGADYDIENYDLKIDDEEATREAREFSESHAIYLDMIEKYKDSGGIPPLVISREQFENEHYHEKCYVNWYEDDDIFEEDDTKIEDPYYTFGFASGREMFSPERVAVRDEEDICYIRNMKMSTDFEITRMHGSYAKMVVDGEVYYHGEANP